MRIRIFFFIALFLLQSPVVFAQTFSSYKLEKMAAVLGIKSIIDTVPSGKSSVLLTKDNIRVVVRKNANHIVEHIGAFLFNEDMRFLMPSPVYDFLEYAVLDKKYNVSTNTLNLSKVIFKKGNWNSLLELELNNFECSIDNKEDKLFIVTWTRNNLPLVIVGIPIEYELLNNDSRRNLEKDLIMNLLLFEGTPQCDQSLPVSEDHLKIYGTEGLFVHQGDSYLIEELNQNTYYVFKTITEYADTIIRNKPVRMTLETVQPVALIDQTHSIESLANLLLCNDNTIPDASVILDFHLSDYHREKVSMSWSQIKCFFQQQGCKLFYAGSGINSGIVKGVLLATNISNGYNHLLSINMPIEELYCQVPNIQAAVYLYIPTIKKEGLFGKMPKKASRAKIY